MIIFILAIVACNAAAESRAIKVGMIKGTKGKHWKRGVGGTVYVVSEKVLKVKNFFFDGGHPGCVGHHSVNFKAHTEIRSSELTSNNSFSLVLLDS